MSNIQQGIQFHLPVKMNNLDLDDVSYIEFIFKLTKDSDADAVKECQWKSDGTGEAQTDEEDDAIILIPFTLEETYLFPSGKPFYFHARIHYNDTDDNPYVPIYQLFMGDTLFAKPVPR